MRNRIAVWAVVLIVVFLIGFIPQYAKSNRLEGELVTANKELKLARARHWMAMTYFEASRKNYASAGEYASQFFNQVRDLSAETDPEVRKRLDELSGYRDQVTAGLAQGDPGVLGQLQELYLKTQAATKT